MNAPAPQIRSGLAKANGIEIYYEDLGDPAHPPVIMTMGLAAQHVYWPEPLVQGLLERGFRVIRYDNRDVGLSTKIQTRDYDRLPTAYLKTIRNRPVKAPYTLYDMVDDAAGLLDALEIGSTHLVGASMGGMISQLFAALHRDRTRSLTSIMSSTLHPSLPAPRLDVLLRIGLIGRRGKGGREAFVKQTVDTYRAIHAKGYPFPTEEIARRAGLAFDRCYHPTGPERQAVGILASGSFQPLLSRVRAPTLVIHGGMDPLVSVEGGKATARAIKGARLEVLPKMGHFMHEAEHALLVKWIAETAALSTRV